MIYLESSLTLMSFKIGIIVTRTVGMSGYPYLSSVENGLGTYGEK